MRPGRKLPASRSGKPWPRSASGCETTRTCFPTTRLTARPWNPDWVTHQIAAAADAAGVDLDIKGGRHYTASQLLDGGFDLRNTAARLGHSGGGATTLRHYADPVPEVDRRAATYLAKLTGRPTSPIPES